MLLPLLQREIISFHDILFASLDDKTIHKGVSNDKILFCKSIELNIFIEHTFDYPVQKSKLLKIGELT